MLPEFASSAGTGNEHVFGKVLNLLILKGTMLGKTVPRRGTYMYDPSRMKRGCIF